VDDSDSRLRFWRNSLAAKFVSLTVVVVFILMSISAFMNYRAQELIITENLANENTMLGNFIASIAPEALLSYDYDRLEHYMTEIGNGKDIMYAAIISPDDKTLASYIDRRARYITQLISQKNTIEIRNIIAGLKDKPGVINLQFPIIYEKKVLANLAIGISKERVIDFTRSRLISTMLLSTLFSVLLGLGIYFIFRVYTLRPIFHLVRGAKRITNEDFDQEVDVKSQDELGRLAVTFNHMMRHIRETNRQKDSALGQVRELNQLLERRVEVRTHELELANQKLEKIALHDSLTNLPNRFSIQDNLNRGIADAKLNGSAFSVIMMDLDRFKEINDTLGHDCGDQLLVEVGRRLQSVLRPTDLVGRLGGDEFAILLPETDEIGAGTVAHKMLMALEPPFEIADMSFNIGASLGIATYPKHGNTTSVLLKSADVAMYQAKNNKLGYCIYNPISDIHTPDRLSLMTELRDAIHNDALELYYQPKVDLAKGTIVGVEALIRWQHKERGFIPPAEFIPMAEQSGLIRQLTNWVISTALMQLDAWHKANLHMHMAINLSMQNLQDTNFPSQLEQLFDQTYTDNKYLQFEITESVIMSNPGYVMGVLAKLGRMNVSFAIDDFGTGYSSLSTLKRLQVQEIKIDKSFIRDMAMNKDDEAIVHSIIDMGHTLGLTVSAEGVESETVIRQLQKLGCNMIQGYYISRPLPADRVTHMMKNGSLNPLEKKVADNGLTVIKGKNN